MSAIIHQDFGQLTFFNDRFEYQGTLEPETIVLDGHDKDGDHVPVLDRKRKRGALMEDKLSIFTNMIQAVKEVASAIRESKPVDVQPDLYNTVMDQGGFSPEALMVTLSYLLDNKAQGVGFLAMGDAHRVQPSGLSMKIPGVAWVLLALLLVVALGCKETTCQNGRRLSHGSQK